MNRALGTSPNKTKEALARGLESCRSRTKRLIAPLSHDDIHAQHNSLMSPLVWDIGHVGNFEELWLLRELDGRAAHDSNYDIIYNPFDNPRWTRGNLQLLNRDEALAYLNEVRGDVDQILHKVDLDPDSSLLRQGYVFRMVIQHEAHHQETILQALNMRTDLPPYLSAAKLPTYPSRSVDDTQRVLIPAGRFVLGTDDTTSAYDNERPQHEVVIPDYFIDKFPVTNRRYATFIDAGGYENRQLWSDAGWASRQELSEGAPQGWARQVGGGWLIRRFGHILDMDPAEPVQHVSYHEAEAFARFEGGRLPTEQEWEKAATWGPGRHSSRPFPWGDMAPNHQVANLGQVNWGPAPVGTYPDGASAYGVEQMLGDVYEWTTSPFEAYPGFQAFPYPEYSEVFFGDPEYRVLRGASWATSSYVARSTFRNWDYRVRRQIFSGIRLAWDA